MVFDGLDSQALSEFTTACPIGMESVIIGANEHLQEWWGPTMARTKHPGNSSKRGAVRRYLLDGSASHLIRCPYRGPIRTEAQGWSSSPMSAIAMLPTIWVIWRPADLVYARTETGFVLAPHPRSHSTGAAARRPLFLYNCDAVVDR